MLLESLSNRFTLIEHILNYFSFVDRFILILLLVLATLSSIALYSASGQNSVLVMQQLIRFGIGFLLMFMLMRVPIKVFYTWTPWLYILGVLLLIAVLFFGDITKGSRRWLDLILFHIQPSELLKIFLPMLLAYLFTIKMDIALGWKFILAILAIVLPISLIILQPDFGTAFLIGAGGSLVIFLAGLYWSWISILLVSGVLSSPVIWNYVMLDYQKQRVLTFLNPESDQFGAGYHIIQSKIAIGSGGVWGKGWMNGTQSQLDFLPERSTDFIFSTFAEEFGFIGILFLFLIYALLIFRGIQIALNANNHFARLLASGLILSFFMYFCINVSMVTGAFPVVGAPLPLFSYGGTSIVTFFASFGILMAIAKFNPIMKDRI